MFLWLVLSQPVDHDISILALLRFQREPEPFDCIDHRPAIDIRTAGAVIFIEVIHALDAGLICGRSISQVMPPAGIAAFIRLSWVSMFARSSINIR
jgi:hypothetical protein